ncbi:helix-turn-helix domain-containing protein [Novosphingobium sp. BL-52-GroH]|uniref:TetR/AcrR family transcriptional regulator n=1 Tax=Novosphingobium sp. BL-52-GroH TaxID=3349877 RepID=UPI00385163B2
MKVSDEEPQVRRFKPSALRLIDAAEKLFGERGIDNVPLQEVAETAGQANKFAVQYHFKTREGLIDAVFEARLPAINRRRQEYVERLRAMEHPTIVDLLWAMIGPVIDQVDAEGKHRYSRFSAQVRIDPRYRAGWFGSRHLAAVNDVIDMLRAATSHLSRAEFDVRMMFVIDIFDSGLRLVDSPEILPPSSEHSASDSSMILETMVAVAAAGLSS